MSSCIFLFVMATRGKQPTRWRAAYLQESNGRLLHLISTFCKMCKDLNMSQRSCRCSAAGRGADGAHLLAAAAECPTKWPSGPDQETSSGSYIRFSVAFFTFSAFHLDLDSHDPGIARGRLGCAASCRGEDKYQHVASGSVGFDHSIEHPFY